jgi:hypothetical protein
VTKRFRSSLKFCLGPKRHYFVHDHNGQALAYVYFEEGSGRRSAAKLVSKDKARRIAVNIASRFYPQRQLLPLDTGREECPQLQCDQMKEVGLADWRTSSGLPSASDPETEADRTPRESLLACMTANREPRLIKALKLTGRRRLTAVASCRSTGTDTR